jgi:hypothetical protein
MKLGRPPAWPFASQDQQPKRSDEDCLADVLAALGAYRKVDWDASGLFQIELGLFRQDSIFLQQESG